MLSRILGFASRNARLVAAVAFLAVAPSMVHAQVADATVPENIPAEAEPNSAYSFNFGTDFTSHFISYGSDVWGGGNHMGPWDDQATNFWYGTMNVSFTEQFSGFVNLWGEKNNNSASGLGGQIQEIDLNVGVTYSIEKLSITASTGWWNYPVGGVGGTEKVVDLTPAYNDADLFFKGWSFNPSVNFHYRYDGNGGQNTGLAVVPAIKPTHVLMPDGKYPVTLAAPIACGLFENGFQGGHGMYGYMSAGVSASVPLSFIPAKYGAWTAGVSFVYYNTNDEALPNNPSTNFVVTDININVSM